MPDPRLALFADAEVGELFLHYLAGTHREDLAVVVARPGSAVERLAREQSLPLYVDADGPAPETLLRTLAGCTLGLLCWWPRLLPADLLSLPRHGFVNTHPSLLPHNRGKHPNFWAIVERRPFGVSLHEVTPGIDSGAVIAQRPVAVGWEDNGGTLHERARSAMFDLLVDTYPALRSGCWTAIPQRLDEGSFHRGAELEVASTIELDRQYTGRALLDLLRARTYPGHPGCRFDDAGAGYEVRIEIRRISKP